ncbi:type II toxin-antitoxin system RelE/ParE family toxin [Mesorhizobium sp. CN2-181]|uniref:type II toxin-antitoxin system RelE/ParE family toxin n=1 Tax=Mesorhizobium yinganensis TaxID=3157707 RepID=UPI0032B7642D
MKLVWTAKARHELAEIVSHIWADNPPAANRIRNRIQTSATYLKSQPFMGRPGAIDGTREAISHPSYRIIYQVADEIVSILSVVHTARQWPPGEDD